MINHFYSDPHFGHKNIIKFCNRPFYSLQDMHQSMVDRYNHRVSKDEVTLWLGDVFFGSKDKAKDIITNLNGTKILVKGNHDKGLETMCEVGFDLVLDIGTLKIADRIATVCHYPYAHTEKERSQGAKIDDRFKDRRPKRIPGQILIHGHTHDHIRRKNNMIHVGVDAWDYRPASWAEVEQLAREI